MGIVLNGILLWPPSDVVESPKNNLDCLDSFFSLDTDDAIVPLYTATFFVATRPHLPVLFLGTIQFQPVQSLSISYTRGMVGSVSAGATVAGHWSF